MNSFKKGLSRTKLSGFTLIELLVVVAIIGILAAVVVAALSSAKGKGNDAAIKSQLNSMRNQSEFYIGTGTAFSVGVCALTADTLFENTAGKNGLGNLFKGITLANTRCVSTAGQPSSGSVSWAVAAQTSTGAWCVDSTGISRDKNASGTLYTTTLTTAIAAAGTSCL